MAWKFHERNEIKLSKFAYKQKSFWNFHEKTSKITSWLSYKLFAEKPLWNPIYDEETFSSHNTFCFAFPPGAKTEIEEQNLIINNSRSKNPRSNKLLILLHQKKHQNFYLLIIIFYVVLLSFGTFFGDVTTLKLNYKLKQQTAAKQRHQNA